MRGYRNEMPAPLLLRHPSSLEHDTGTHPERPARIVAIERALAERDWLGWDVRESPAAEREVVCAVHPEAYVEHRWRPCRAAGGGALDADTVVSEGSYRAALHAAGGAAAIVDALLGGDGPRVGASLHRPPGHHALPARAMGFCLFNNVAVAARRALDRWGAERVLILDWDVHHGNGTNDIFHRDPDVLYVSIHESPLYPGTGPAARRGLRAGGGLHGQPARAGGVGRRGVVLAGRARRRLARARVPPGPDPALGRLRRARARSAGGLSRHARGLRADGGEHARRWPTSSTCRSAWCSRAATTSRRWPSRRWRRSRWSAPRSRRSARPWRCTRWPRRPRGGWRSAGRWWARSPE